jgi:hypothetical protein
MEGGLIDATMDRYKGVIIEDLSLLADSEEAFEAQLKESMENWRG